MDKLPAIVKARAMGGGGEGAAAAVAMLPGLNSPEDTFGLLRDMLQGLESRLRSVQSGVEKRNALAAATPSIWPATGWLTSSMGSRGDPFTGAPDFHPGLDISADRGSPVHATADGTVSFAGASGAYGNLVTIDHGFGLESRYGHLSRLDVAARRQGQARRSHRRRRRDRPRHRTAPALRSAGQRPAAQSAPVPAEERPPGRLTPLPSAASLP